MRDRRNAGGGALLLRQVKIGHMEGRRQERPRCSPGEGARGENELTRIGGLALTTLSDGMTKVLRPLPDFREERGNVAPSLFAFRGDQIGGGHREE